MTYLILNGEALKTGPGQVAWVFPHLQNIQKKSMANKVTSLLKLLVEFVDELTDWHTSHGLRGGVMDDMLANYLCPLISAICQGNWKLEGTTC